MTNEFDVSNAATEFALAGGPASAAVHRGTIGTAVRTLLVLVVAMAAASAAFSAEGDWSNDQLYREGWRASRLMGKPVRNNEKVIGEVSDLIINGNGDLERLLVRSHGLVATGENNFGVVWPLVTLARDFSSVTVPVSEEFATLYNADRVVLTPNRWSVKRLLGARVVVEGPAEYGRMDDVIFNREGQIRAIVVDPAAPEKGLTAIPWRDVRVADDHQLVEVPLKMDEITRSDDFRYERMGSATRPGPNGPAPSGAPK